MTKKVSKKANVMSLKDFYDSAPGKTHLETLPNKSGDVPRYGGAPQNYQPRHEPLHASSSAAQAGQVPRSSNRCQLDAAAISLRPGVDDRQLMQISIIGIS